MKGWEMINKVKVLSGEGKNVSWISRTLGIDRKTVRKYRDMDMDDIVKYREQRRGRKQKVDAYKVFIDHQLKLMKEDGVINAQAIFDKVIHKGFSGSSRTLRRYVRLRIGKHIKRQRIYEPFETEMGKQAMVDIGESRKVWINTKRSVEYFLVMTLSFSRKMYVEWFDRPIDTEMFIRFHQNAFTYIGGIPKEIVYDQTKLAVIREQYGEINFNSEFLGFSKWAGFKNFICKKSDPETKGKVESSVRYIKRGFLPGRRFSDHRDLDRQWFEWLHKVADVKPNETTGDPPDVRFEKEKSSLEPLQDTIYTPRPSFKEQPVYKDGFVKVLGSRYSVPWEYHQKKVKVRICDLTIEFYTTAGKHIFTHERCFEKNKRIKIRTHYQRPSTESTESLSQEVLAIYGDPRLLEELQDAFPRHFREQCRQLIRLTEIFNQDILRQASYSMLTLGGVSYSKIKQVAYHYHQLAYNSKMEELENIPPSCHEIPVFNLEERTPEYYDQIEKGVFS